MGKVTTILVACIMVTCSLTAEAAKKPATVVPVVQIKSTLDGSMQPSQLIIPDSAKPGAAGPKAPLLVVLHTWSGNYLQKAPASIRVCKRRGWIFLHPNFRGPSATPQGCGSELAVQDVLDAVAYVQANAQVDEKRIYVLGASGGGHMALLLAAKAPEKWAAVSACVPITDLAAWHAFCAAKKLRYARHMERACGGPPGTDKTDAEYRKRSPIHVLAKAKGLPIDLMAGIHDGHKRKAQGLVPISHTLNAYNVLVEANGQADKKLTQAQMDVLVKEAKVPPSLATETGKEPGMRVLFRRTTDLVRLTVYDGGHSSQPLQGLNWLVKQNRK